MAMRSNRSKETQRAQWFSQFEDAFLKLRPELCGKIDWDTATFLLNQHNTPEDAAKKMASH